MLFDEQTGHRERISMGHVVTPYDTFNLIQYDTEQEFERSGGPS
jgi:hypothetical protein